MKHAELYRKLANKELNGVVIASELVLNSLNKLQPVDRRLELSKDTIMVLNNVFYLSKNSSILSDPIDRHIQLYQEAGLIDAWARRHADRINVRNRLDKRHPRKLHIKNILGAVVISSIMTVLCVVVFFMELIASKVPIMKCIIDYLTY